MFNNITNIAAFTCQIMDRISIENKGAIKGEISLDRCSESALLHDYASIKPIYGFNSVLTTDHYSNHIRVKFELNDRIHQKVSIDKSVEIEKTANRINADLNDAGLVDHTVEIHDEGLTVEYTLSHFDGDKHKWYEKEDVMVNNAMRFVSCL